MDTTKLENKAKTNENAELTISERAVFRRAPHLIYCGG